MGRGETGKEEESRDSNRHRKSKSMYALEVRTHTHTQRERETPGKISGRPTGELEDDIIEPLGSGEAQLVLSSFCSFLPSFLFLLLHSHPLPRIQSSLNHRWFISGHRLLSLSATYSRFGSIPPDQLILQTRPDQTQPDTRTSEPPDAPGNPHHALNHCPV